MAAAPRESAFMPSIKCSSCGLEIEISMMGDHVCSGPADRARADSSSRPAAAPGDASVDDTFMPLGTSVHDKIGSIPPVDTAIANRSYSRQPRTPMSLSSGSRSVSPRTPGARPSTGRADDYFAPTIAVNDEHGLPPQSAHPDAYGGYGEAEPEPAYPVASPKQQGLSLLTRMENIAPGPYAQHSDGQQHTPGLRTQPSRQSDHDGRPGTSASSNGGGPPRMPRNHGYGGFGPPARSHDQPDSIAALNRSETFPNRPLERPEQPLRAPSAPGPRPDRIRDTSRAPPPRTSLVRSPINNPNINLEAEFGSKNPYHSPSASIASSASLVSSQASQPSSSTSPSRSGRGPRKPSRGGSLFEALVNDVQSPVGEQRPRSPDARPSPIEESRYDPAMQGGRPPSPPHSKWDRTDRQDPAVQGAHHGHHGPPKTLPPSPAEPPSRRETHGQKSRGSCKACNQAITGKSVSSADGRLTGRYHKACFACTTCKAPFQTAEFYVHGDRPFCKFHYHEKNGSLCGSCSDGIEGQYLEDERYTKYHVNCFRCGDCQRVLSDGYFDVDGGSYCERDAFRRLQARVRSPSMSSQRSYGSSPLAPPGRPGMRLPPGAGIPPRPMGAGPGRMGQPMPRGGPGMGAPGMGLAPAMPKMEKRRTRLGMM